MHAENSLDEADRVRRHTSPEILDRIEADIEQSIAFYSTQPREAITRRIAELDREWDMERVLETNASVLALSGALLGLTSSKKWFLLTGTVLGFLLEHALSGWCPPVPVMRRLGVRTRSEIDREKFALKALRGDFKDLPIPERPANPGQAKEILQTVTE